MSQQPFAFINIFEVEPTHQRELIDVLRHGADEVIRNRPGFVAIALYASHDGRRVINLTQWDTADAARATQADPDAVRYAARATALATSDPGAFTLAAEIR